jgi:sortase A
MNSARIAGGALCIVAALSLGFLAQLGLIGNLQHHRSQQREYADLRASLAQQTAPVAPLDADGRLVAPGIPVAVLEVPRIGLREVVAEGTSAGVLACGPGHQRNTVLPGQSGTSVLMGRRVGYGGPFARIGQLRRGDEVRVTTGQGRHTFAVLGIRHSGDQQLTPAAGTGLLTLITADGPLFAPTDALRVDALLTSEVQPTPRRAIPAGWLPVAEEPMSGDAGTLVPMTLWGQLLFLAAIAIVWVRYRAGRWHAWVIGVPVLGVLGVTVADQAARLLPNLL